MSEPGEDEVRDSGRPANGKGLRFNATLRPELAARIDAWIARQATPRPTRAEAIRQLVEEGLAAVGMSVTGEPSSIPVEQLNASNDE